MTANKIVSIIVYSLIAILMPPTIAILATWNSLPGDKLYPIKRDLEKIAAVIVSPSFAARSELELQLIERRIAENEKIFSANLSTAGLGELTAQAYSAQQLILMRKGGKIDAATVQKFTTKLRKANQMLETQKRQIAYTAPTPITQPPIIIEKETVKETVIKEVPKIQTPPPKTTTPSTPTPAPTTPASTPTIPSTTTQEPEEIIEEIETTQQEIEDIIDELETTINETSSTGSDTSPTTDQTQESEAPDRSSEAPGHNKEKEEENHRR